MLLINPIIPGAFQTHGSDPPPSPNKSSHGSDPGGNFEICLKVGGSCLILLIPGGT